MFVEFFPDPTNVPDNEGEYAEIRLDDFRSDSIYVRLDEKSALAFAFPKGANRMLLTHDSSLCPRRDSLFCGALGSVTLPNSRESVWRLWAGACRDSVSLPRPKAGRAFQRIGESGEFAFTDGTPGTADAAYELGIEDCGIEGAVVESLSDENFRIRAILSGCDSSLVYLEYLDLFSAGGLHRLERHVSGQFSFSFNSRGPAWLRLFVPPDAAPANDTLDTLVFLPENPPVVITEIHHCPVEPMPEWVEVFNNSKYPLPLSRIRFCDRGSIWGNSPDSLQPYESLVVTKDSLALREQLGYADVRIVQSSMGYLNNSSGSISVCFGGALLDSASWEKTTVNCPSGFNPLTMLAENTPGFQGRSKSKKMEEPFEFKLSSRIVSKHGNPLRVGVYGENSVTVELQDSAGHSLWSENVPAFTNGWSELPVQEKCKIGINYVSLSSGSFKKVVGFVVRP